ncbi:MAG TPA: Rpn family recombination-promoting nuclease/putative transposase [Chitinispirillaceae bacterium]|nr:Rpn family recombination-promoting nuclease/putative transposase [Chitinispirillaceae bacterium]
MKSNRLKSPHDRFFRAMFSKKEVALSFATEFLLKRISIQIDTQSLESVENDSVNSFLKASRSDVIYKVTEKTTRNNICLLFEHKSFHDTKTVAQLKRYMDFLENDFLHSNKFEIIIPIVIYHGGKKWVDLYRFSSTN